MRTIVVAGASLAGLRAVEALRAGGWEERLLVVGAEPWMPYSRPPLSKGLWSDDSGYRGVELRRRASADTAHWLLGSPVTASDLAARVVTVGDEVEVEYAGLVVTTGVRPRRLRAPGPSIGRVTLRTYDDYRVARATLERESAEVVVVGSGFIGCEIAASAAATGASVTVVSLDQAPMQHPLGTTVGTAVRGRLEEAGVRFRLGHTVTATLGDSRVRRVVLDDGTELPCNLMIETLGSAPNTEWLEGNELDLTDGVLCDGGLRAIGAEHVVVAGDVARFADPLFGGGARRVEHWGIPGPSAKHAAATLLADLAGYTDTRRDFSVLPSFWSDQGPVRIQAFGELAGADDVAVADGSLESDCVLVYSRRGDPVGIAVIGLPQAAKYWQTWLRSELTAQVHGDRARQA